ncbi:GGDEF and EAL domain-containing protein [Colwellia sp. E2M01]|uniref:putative bifunctional diguanylate cyclase/phosphodiesterase n=1 Tax=Colwellia sp. E2M01 TaxID=2841561 RepID=UPI001C083DC2|nr:GGDEF and EAL domain-containing protein [Colwellia sp. E2M01]MBU2871864.1 EAL domain-containing protein [Colwellia sp. E2M01]
MQEIEKFNADRFELVINAAGMGVWDWNIKTETVFFSERMAEIIGYCLDELQPISFATWFKYIHPEDLQKANERLASHLQGDAELYEVAVRMKHKHGEYVWVLIAGKTIEWHEDGSPKRMLGFHREITLRKIDEQKLITTSYLLDESQRIAKVGGWQLDVLSGELFWTTETYRIHETTAEEFNPTVDAVFEYFIPESRVLIEKALDNAINRGIGYDLELTTYTTKGKLIDVRATCIVTMKDNKAVRLTGIFQDISEEKSIQRTLKNSNRALEQVNIKLERNANYDALTGLPNRNLLADRMQQTIEHSKRSENSVAIAFIDLDRFKEINDAYGHSFGDELLCSIANQFTKLMRSCDTLARFGGDEFVMILDELEHPDDCIVILKRILDSISKTVLLKNKAIQVSASIGVTIYPQDNSNSDQLLRHADQAMYIAKNTGKNCFHIFDVAKDVAEKNQHEELENIRLALNNNEFDLFYQPKINIKTNNVIGVEALIRWRHPERGILPPIMFLPIIEQDILDIKVGEWVIEKALTQLSLWSEKNINIPISVNISPLQLQSLDFVKRLKVILKKFPHFRAGSIEFEILETSALKEINQVTKVIQECHQLGIVFSIDDFGTGYSSLSYLKRLPTEYLKIDQSFIRDMLMDADDKAIVIGIIGLAKAFSRKIIAEGVETTDHGEQLLILGCHLAQGYGIARPMPADDFILWLEAWEKENDWEYLCDVGVKKE